MKHYKRLNRSSSSTSIPSFPPSPTCSPRRRPRRRSAFVCSPSRTPCAKRSSASVACSRVYRRQRAGENEHLSRQAPGSSVTSGAWLVMFTPAALSRSTSSRFRGSSANCFTDAATTGPISATDCSASIDASSNRSMVGNCAPASRRLLADVPDAEGINQARQVDRLLRSIWA